MSVAKARPEAEFEELMSSAIVALERIAEILKDYATFRIKALNGETLGRQIASYYRELAGSGMPEEDVRLLTREYAKALLESVPPLTDVADRARGGFIYTFEGPEAGDPEKAISAVEERLKEIEDLARSMRPQDVEEVAKRLFRLAEKLEDLIGGGTRNS